jgi:peptidoglycan/LPS O-acetylase OafA/YrhL
LVADWLGVTWCDVVALCLVLTIAVGVQHGSIDVGATFPGVIGSAPRMIGEFAGGMVLLRAHRAGWGANGGVRWWVAAVVGACFYLLPKDHDWSLAFDLFAIAVVLPACILLAAGSAPITGLVATHPIDTVAGHLGIAEAAVARLSLVPPTSPPTGDAPTEGPTP